jgi:GNAT superfamily N-acetyltransferase
MRGVSAGLLEQFVFSKPYFDPAGLIIAERDHVPVGFIHAGFGASDDETTLSREMGTTYLLLLRDDYREAELADQLLARAEGYLRDAGAKVIYAGGIRPLDAFYRGLYGGSELPGVLASDTSLIEACLRSGYRAIDHVAVLQREIATFRAPVSREQRQLRREMVVREEFSPPAKTWWNACTMGDFDQLHYLLEPAGGGAAVADVWFWNIEPLSTAWGVTTAGLYDLHVAAERRRQGVATFLLGEALSRMASRGMVRVEAQTMQSNTPALALYTKFGFEQIDEGTVYRKE